MTTEDMTEQKQRSILQHKGYLIMALADAKDRYLDKLNDQDIMGAHVEEYTMESLKGTIKTLNGPLGLPEMDGI